MMFFGGFFLNALNSPYNIREVHLNIKTVDYTREILFHGTTWSTIALLGALCNLHMLADREPHAEQS